RQCVVKQFQPSGNLSPQQLEVAQGLFEREAEVLEQLGNKHEQIPDLYAFFPLIVPNRLGNQEDQFFYLVQEFIDGQNLEEELATKGRFSEAEVRFVLEEMLKVLQFVHNKGSIHRDIKPSNIMRDQQGRLYLLDFGAVKQVAAGVGSNPQGRSTGIYSMGFAPPEQMAGTQVYPSTDLYALAATCLNLLTGKPTEELYDAYHNDWKWKSYAPKISQRLADILNRMLLPAPKDRFQSAAEVLNALNTAPAASPPPPTKMQSSPSQPVKPTPASNQPPPPVKSPPQRRPLSIFDILYDAAFTGFEGALLGIALASVLSAPNIIMGVWGMTMGGLIFAQYRRIIEKFEWIVFAGISLAIVGFIPILHQVWVIASLQKSLIGQQPIFNNIFYVVLLVAVLGGSVAIAITAFFRLIYQLLTRLL
ncbi:MAG: protein kinase domain-containing protein, partial [Microcystaceae cyanobacterium]